MAGAVFAQLVRDRGLSDHFDRIESAGTADYHIGEEPDERTVAECKRRGVPVTSIAQQAVEQHFREFDYILAMVRFISLVHYLTYRADAVQDKNNLANLQRIQPKGSKAKLQLFGDYGDGKPIADPYYGPKNGFQTTYTQCVAYSEGLLAHLGFEDAKTTSLKRTAKA